MIAAPSIRPDISSCDYHAGVTPTRALTQSTIKTLLRETPADAIQPPKRKSADMDFGTIVHKLALGKGDEFTISPFDEFRTKEARAWRDEALANGETIIKADKLDEAETVAAIIRERIAAAFDGADYETEVPFFWLEGDTWCSGCMDVWCEERLMVIDPKITQRVHRPDGQIAAFGWDIQAAWYQRGLAAINPEWAGRVRFANLLIHPQPPHRHRMVQISEAWREIAEGDCLRALATFRRCMADNYWPGYADSIEMLEPPPWAVRQAMDREIMETEE